MAARYAFSFVPENGTPLADLGRKWLGRDVYSSATQDQPIVLGVVPERLAELTKWRRHDGMHSLLKPPFQLNPATNINGLIETAHIMVRNLEAVEIPQLEINVIGQFIVLTPTIPSRRIVELASQCVRVFDGYRLPLMLDLNTGYIREKLTVYQNRMLKHWGYPFVMEEFQFFVPLTDRIEDDTEREILTKALAQLCKPTIAHPVSIKALTLIGQESRKDPMRVIKTIPFGRL